MLIKLIAIFILILMIVIYALHNIIGPTCTGYILFVVGLFSAQIFNELKKFSDRFEQSPDQTLIRGRLARPLQFLSSMLSYFDLSLILLSILVLCHVSYNSFVNDLADLTNKGFVTFPKDGGLSYLNKNVGGYIFGTTLLIVLSFYGFTNGLQLRKMSFWKLFCSILLGLFLSIVLISIFKGRWTGLDNFREILQDNRIEIPVGAKYLIHFLLIGLIIFIIFALPFYVWGFSWLGYGIGILLHKIVALRLRDQNNLKL